MKPIDVHATPDPVARTAKNVPTGSGLLNHSPKQSRRSE